MRLGFVTALASEARTLAFSDNGKDLELERDVEIAGVGTKNASQASMRLLERGAEGLISWGTAGALDDQLRPGSVVIYNDVHTITGDVYRCNAEWRAQLFLALSALEPIKGSGFTADRAVANSHEKIAIQNRFGCVALDMESAAVGAQANAENVPFVAVRVIVDPLYFDIPQAAICALSYDGNPRTWPVIRRLTQRPQELPSLLKLVRWYRIALRTLTLAAETLQPNFEAK